MTIGIYKIISPHGKIYIGQSWNIENRWKHYRHGDTRTQHRLRNTFNKYGVNNHKFSIELAVDDTITQDQLNSWEQFFMDFYKGRGYEMLNLRAAGSKGKHSLETRKKMSESSKGKKMSLECRRKMKEGRQGRGRAVLCIDTGEMFTNVRTAAETMFGNKKCHSIMSRSANSSGTRRYKGYTFTHEFDLYGTFWTRGHIERDSEFGQKLGSDCFGGQSPYKFRDLELLECRNPEEYKVCLPRVQNTAEV